MRDVDIMRFLCDATDAADKRSRLARKIGEIIDAGTIQPARAVCFQPKDTVQKLRDAMKEQDHPVLVTQDIGDEPRLLGIVTPFDLL